MVRCRRFAPAIVSASNHNAANLLVVRADAWVPSVRVGPLACRRDRPPQPPRQAAGEASARTRKDKNNTKTTQNKRESLGPPFCTLCGGLCWRRRRVRATRSGSRALWRRRSRPARRRSHPLASLYEKRRRRLAAREPAKITLGGRSGAANVKASLTLIKRSAAARPASAAPGTSPAPPACARRTQRSLSRSGTASPSQPRG